MLDTELVERYKADGFVGFHPFFSAKETVELVERTECFIRDVVPSLPREQVFYEDKMDKTTLKQIQHVWRHDEWFRSLFLEGKVREVAEVLLRGEVVPKNLQYFNKPPSKNQPTPPHQDGYYFMLEPCEALTFWLALDPADEENGCVRYVKGSHQRGMREHGRTKVLGFSQGIVDFPLSVDRASEVAIHAQPGDLLAHDALTIHRADSNRSGSKPRRALGFIYYSARAKENREGHAHYQRTLARALERQGKI